MPVIKKENSYGKGKARQIRIYSRSMAHK